MMRKIMKWLLILTFVAILVTGCVGGQKVFMLPTATPTPTLAPTPTKTPIPKPNFTPSPQWPWCLGCTDWAELWGNEEKIEKYPYFRSGATIITPISGKVRLTFFIDIPRAKAVNMIEKGLKIKVNGENLEPQYDIYVYISEGDNLIYEIDVLSTHYPDAVVSMGDWVNEGDVVLKYLKGEGITRCHLYKKENNKWEKCEGDP